MTAVDVRYHPADINCNAIFHGTAVSIAHDETNGVFVIAADRGQ